MGLAAGEGGRPRAGSSDPWSGCFGALQAGAAPERRFHSLDVGPPSEAHLLQKHTSLETSHKAFVRQRNYRKHDQAKRTDARRQNAEASSSCRLKVFRCCSVLIGRSGIGAGLCALGSEAAAGVTATPSCHFGSEATVVVAATTCHSGSQAEVVDTTQHLAAEAVSAAEGACSAGPSPQPQPRGQCGGSGVPGFPTMLHTARLSSP